MWMLVSIRSDQQLIIFVVQGGLTPWMQAARCGRLDVLRLLLEDDSVTAAGLLAEKDKVGSCVV